MILLLAACGTPADRPPLVDARYGAPSELQVTIRARDAVCLFDRTPLPKGDGTFRLSARAHQLVSHEDCRVHLRLGEVPAAFGSEGGWSVGRCLQAGEKVERTIHLTEPLHRWQVQDEFWPGLQRRFSVTPEPELRVDVEYAFPDAYADHGHRTIQLDGSDVPLRTAPRPLAGTHWASSPPLAIPGKILAEPTPCVPGRPGFEF